MCGIAGIIDLSGKRRPAPAGAIRKMADAIIHRGPDEDGYLERPGLAFASRRLSIVGLADGRQPIFNEDRSVAVVFNGELFDYPEMKAELEGRGHRFATHCDTEIIPHRWEDHQEGMFEHLRGQFAVALWDETPSPHRPRPRPLRHLSALLDAADDGRRRMAAVRLGDQGASRLRHGRSEARPARHQPRCSRSSRCPAPSPASRASRRCCPAIT